MDIETLNRHKGITGTQVTDQAEFVLSLLTSLQTATSGKLMNYAMEQYPWLTHTKIANIHKRLPELADRGAVRKQTTSYGGTYITRCPVTGKMACVWEITGNGLAPMTARQRIETAITKTEARLAVLKRKLAKI